MPLSSFEGSAGRAAAATRNPWSGKGPSCDDHAMTRALPSDRALAIAAVVGMAVVVFADAFTVFEFAPRQGRGFVLAALLTTLVGCFLRFGLPGAWSRLLRHPQLLVPLGLALTAELVLGWIALVPLVAELFQPSYTTPVATVSLWFVLSALIWTVHAAWATVLVMDVVTRDVCSPSHALTSAVRWVPRTAGVCLLGWAIVLVGAVPMLVLGPGSHAVTLPVLAVQALLANVLTAALLPVALDMRLSFGGAFLAGVHTGFSLWRRWWKPVVAQCLLLGVVTLLHVTWPGNVRQNLGVHGFWTGAYDHQTYWYGKYMSALDAPQTALVATWLTLVMGAMAVAVKLHVVEQWVAAGEDHDASAIDDRT